MATFRFSLVSPEKLLFAGQVDQVDLPGTEGDFGVLADHAPIVAALRPGIVTVNFGTDREKFVVYGGPAEFATAELTVLADLATSIEDVDLTELKTRIEEVQEGFARRRARSRLALLDHYQSIHINLAPAILPCE
jgi:F-type H+-transporting ATPase subunit epsilon